MIPCRYGYDTDLDEWNTHASSTSRPAFGSIKTRRSALRAIDEELNCMTHRQRSPTHLTKPLSAGDALGATPASNTMPCEFLSLETCWTSYPSLKIGPVRDLDLNAAALRPNDTGQDLPVHPRRSPPSRSQNRALIDGTSVSPHGPAASLSSTQPSSTSRYPTMMSTSLSSLFHDKFEHVRATLST